MPKTPADALPVSPERRAIAEKRLRYAFKNPALLSQALCHASTHDEGHASNERLEFLGDSVLNLLSSWFLYEGLKDSNEGELTKRRAQLTSGEALSKIAQRLDLGDLLLIGKNQDVSASSSIYGNMLEALIGAMFLDGGLEAAQDFVIREVLTQPKQDEAKQEADAFEDPKSKLQHHTLRLRLGLPEYRVVDEQGPGHNLTFTMEVLVQGNPLGRGQGTSKKLASQEAAKQGLTALLASEEDTKKIEEIAQAPKKPAKKAAKKKSAKKTSKKSAKKSTKKSAH